MIDRTRRASYVAAQNIQGGACPDQCRRARLIPGTKLQPRVWFSTTQLKGPSMRALRTTTSAIVLTLAVTTAPALGQEVCLSSQTIQCMALSPGEAIECVPPSPKVELRVLGGERAGLFNTLASEIAAFEPHSRRLFVVNVAADVVDRSVPNGKPSLRVIDASNPSKPRQVRDIDLAGASGFSNVVPTSVAAAHRVVAASVIDGASGNGKVLFFNEHGVKLNEVAVGFTPDMVTFGPLGLRLLVANAGEGAGGSDPEGSISIVDVLAGGLIVRERRVSFAAFNDPAARARLVADGVRLFSEKPDATVADMLQPEYIAISPDLRTAWVTLEVNNAIAVVDLWKAKVIDVLGLGLKDHAAPGNGFDASDRDGPANSARENIQSWRILGMYQPDAIAAYRAEGMNYLITANEGDSREFEEARAADLAAAAPEYTGDILTSNAKLARLKVSRFDGFDPVSGKYGILRAFGGRSFSIWTASADQVFDSGDAIECITAKVGKAAVDPVGPLFNTPDDEKSPDLRSDDRGPEPEGVAVGRYRGRTYAFIALERPGGLMVYDVTDPRSPAFQQYINPRDATADPQDPQVLCKRGELESEKCAAIGDLGPEGVLFVAAFKSPTGRPLVVTANETSGSTRIYELIDRAE